MDVEKLAIDLLLKGMTQEQQTAALESIKDSVTQAKTIQKQRIGENVNVVIQALRKMEADLRGEYSDVADKLSERITSIKDGQDGHNGSDGRAGKDGRAGRDGVAGKKGEDGLPGRDGIDGVDGVSVTDASIDFDGSLVITLSNGRVINVGEVVSQELANNIKVISTMSTNGAVGIQDEGTSVSTGVKNINFVGATVTATASGDDVTVNVSAGTGTVTSVAATAGTGISVTGSPITTTGTLNITNTAPDQVVALTGSGGTTVTGTYPSFTISSSGGSGTVTSVAVSGGTTGLTTSGGPITTTGTITLAGTLAVANGGTGVTTSTGTTNVVLSNSPTLVSPALGTPASGVVTNLTGTASININGTVGATTPATGAFTTLSSTGNTTLGDATTDTVTVSGYVAVGGAPVTSAYGLHVRSTALNTTQQYGIVSSPTITSAATSQGGGLYASVSTAANIFTVVSIWALRITDGSKGAGSTISNNSGISITDLTNGTNNYGIVCDLSTGANKYNIYASGTAQNVFAGNVRIGSTVAPTVALDVTGAALISSTLGVTGVSTFAAGTVALPSITTSGDTNTGVYFPAADTVGITTGGAQRGAFSSTGLAVTGLVTVTTGIKTGASATTLSIFNGNVDSATTISGGSTVALGAAVVAFGESHATRANTLDFRVTNVTYASITSTGLAVTGALSATTTGKVGTTLGVGAATPSASGSGITFPATQSASTDVNTLDDYEEGTFTPTITALTGSFTTITNQTGKYTKIGNVVNVYISFAISSIGTATTGFNAGNLQFANVASVNSPVSGVNVSTDVPFGGYVAAGGTSIRCFATLTTTNTYNVMATYFTS